MSPGPDIDSLPGAVKLTARRIMYAAESLGIHSVLPAEPSGMDNVNGWNTRLRIALANDVSAAVMDNVIVLAYRRNTANAQCGTTR